MSRFLVTGGAGFIGSHLCDALVRRGDTVRVLDDLSTGHRSNLPEGVELTVGDIADPDTALAATEGVDGCFHLAAIASVERGVNDWLGTHRANLTGTIAILDAIRRHGTRTPVVYASSAAVYGDCRTIPIPEAAERRPLSAYGADKYGCELHALTASHVHGIPTTGLRFFNVYGPRQDPRSPYSGVISIFCERILAGQPIRVYGDGAQTRDFIHVGDVVAALGAAMRAARDARPADAPGVQRLHGTRHLGRGTGRGDRRSGREKSERRPHARPRRGNPPFPRRPDAGAGRPGLGRSPQPARGIGHRAGVAAAVAVEAAR